MRNLEFHYIKAENILCFGPEGIEFEFANYGNIVQIKGVNLDYPGTDDDPASNATGKSSIQELLSIGLYGKTVKNPTKLKGGSVINTLASKGELEIKWDEYRITRSFKKSSSGSVTSKLRVWQSADGIWDDSTEKTQGKSISTQKWIESQIGLNHHAFCNVVVFDDSNSYSFLESDTPKKREFVENLLGLDQYRDYHSNAKEMLKEQKKLVDAIGGQYESIQRQSEECVDRIAKTEKMEIDWKSRKKQELISLMSNIKSKQSKLEESFDDVEEISAWERSRERIEELKTEIEKKENQKKKTESAIDVAREKFQSSRGGKVEIEDEIQTKVLAIKSAQSELNKSLVLIKKLENLEDGAKCPTCHGVISNENYGTVLQHGQNVVEGCNSAIDKTGIEVEASRVKLSEKTSAIKKMENAIKEAEKMANQVDSSIRTMQSELAKLSKLSKPDSNARQQVLESEISGYKRQLAEKKSEFEGESPYREIILQTKEEVESKKVELKEKGKELSKQEKEIPYYEFWVKAFGDNGIRKYVIDGIIPALNTRVSYWMQYLIDNKIELSFDNMLNVTLTRNGNEMDYYGTSNGERRRINLAVSQAFSYVMMLNSGSCPSLVFLDEITGGGIDRSGVVGVYNMIFELAKERQVFVTTHNENLISMLQGSEEIRLKKHNDITVLV